MKKQIYLLIIIQFYIGPCLGQRYWEFQRPAPILKNHWEEIKISDVNKNQLHSVFESAINSKTLDANAKYRINKIRSRNLTGSRNKRLIEYEAFVNDTVRIYDFLSYDTGLTHILLGGEANTANIIKKLFDNGLIIPEEPSEYYELIKLIINTSCFNDECIKPIFIESDKDIGNYLLPKDASALGFTDESKLFTFSVGQSWISNHPTIYSLDGFALFGNRIHKVIYQIDAKGNFENTFFSKDYFEVPILSIYYDKSGYRIKVPDENKTYSLDENSLLNFIWSQNYSKELKMVKLNTLVYDPNTSEYIEPKSESINQPIEVHYELVFPNSLGVQNFKFTHVPENGDFISSEIKLDSYDIDRTKHAVQELTSVILRKTLLTPQLNGTLPIESLGAQITIVITTNKKDFFGNKVMKSLTMEIKSQTVHLRVE